MLCNAAIIFNVFIYFVVFSNVNASDFQTEISGIFRGSSEIAIPKHYIPRFRKQIYNTQYTTSYNIDKNYKKFNVIKISRTTRKTTKHSTYQVQVYEKVNVTKERNISVIYDNNKDEVVLNNEEKLQLNSSKQIIDIEKEQLDTTKEMDAKNKDHVNHKELESTQNVTEVPITEVTNTETEEQTVPGTEKPIEEVTTETAIINADDEDKATVPDYSYLTWMTDITDNTKTTKDLILWPSFTDRQDNSSKIVTTPQREEIQETGEDMTDTWLDMGEGADTMVTTELPLAVTQEVLKDQVKDANITQTHGDLINIILGDKDDKGQDKDNVTESQDATTEQSQTNVYNISLPTPENQYTGKDRPLFPTKKDTHADKETTKLGKETTEQGKETTDATDNTDDDTNFTTPYTGVTTSEENKTKNEFIISKETEIITTDNEAMQHVLDSINAKPAETARDNETVKQVDGDIYDNIPGWFLVSEDADMETTRHSLQVSRPVRKKDWFTIFCLDFIDMLKTRDPAIISELIKAFTIVINRMQSAKELEVLGNPAPRALTLVGPTLQNWTHEHFIARTREAEKKIISKDDIFTNLILALINKGFTEADKELAKEFYKNVAYYPKNKRNSLKIIEQMIDLILTPVKRVKQDDHDVYKHHILHINSEIFKKFDISSVMHLPPQRRADEGFIDRIDEKKYINDFIKAAFAQNIYSYKRHANNNYKYNTPAKSTNTNFNKLRFMAFKMFTKPYKVTEISKKNEKNDSNYVFRSNNERDFNETVIIYKRGKVETPSRKKNTHKRTKHKIKHHLRERHPEIYYKLKKKHDDKRNKFKLYDRLNEKEYTYENALKNRILKCMNKDLSNNGNDSTELEITIRKRTQKRVGFETKLNKTVLKPKGLIIPANINKKVSNISRELSEKPNMLSIPITTFKSNIIKPVNIPKTRKNAQNNNKHLTQTKAKIKQAFKRNNQKYFKISQKQSHYLKPVDFIINKNFRTPHDKFIKENNNNKSIFAESSYSDDENELKWHLADAIRHGNNVYKNYRKTADLYEKLVNIKDIFKEDSYSDGEAVIKNNIYKAFGHNMEIKKEI